MFQLYRVVVVAVEALDRHTNLIAEKLTQLSYLLC